MREPLDRNKLDRFLAALGRAARGGGTVYLTGGATAITYGWRERTIDIDLRLDPEPPGAFEAIARLKDELDVNVELASPDQFVPPVPGWRERSAWIARHGSVDFFHFDPLSQALAKLARGHDRDLGDVTAMLERGLVSTAGLLDAFEQIRGELVRHPGLDAPAFERRVRAFAGPGHG